MHRCKCMRLHMRVYGHRKRVHCTRESNLYWWHAGFVLYQRSSIPILCPHSGEKNHASSRPSCWGIVYLENQLGKVMKIEMMLVALTGEYSADLRQAVTDSAGSLHKGGPPDCGLSQRRADQPASGPNSLAPVPVVMPQKILSSLTLMAAFRKWQWPILRGQSHVRSW